MDTTDLPDAAGGTAAGRRGLDGLPLLAAAVILTALAAGTGWGIRGQYGHETGAMISGSLAALTLVLLFLPTAPSWYGARAAAMMAVAIGVGGSMTYGQTLGLTQNSEVIGNADAWWWGMLGVAIKGGVWIGTGGLFLGMGLGGRRYGPWEMLFLLAAAIGLYFLGVHLINQPFDPENGTLPRFYFSGHWDFEPERHRQGTLNPRFEQFGGYWLALIGLCLYVRLVRGDRLALRMACIGILGGALGFSTGQAIQSAHAWHPDWFAEGGRFGFGHRLFAHFNWWNVMETTFGAVWGAVVGAGLWFNRRLIAAPPSEERATVSPPVEIFLAVVYLSLVLVGEFEYLREDLFVAAANWYIEIGLLIVSLPLIGIVGGRLMPWLTLLVLIPAVICGKTLVAALRQTDTAGIWSDNAGFAWYILVQVPLAITLVTAAWLIHRARTQTTARSAAVALALMSAIYFCLNTVMFGFPDLTAPIDGWNTRHPNQWFFLFSTACLVLFSLSSLIVFPGSVGRRAESTPPGSEQEHGAVLS